MRMWMLPVTSPTRERQIPMFRGIEELFVLGHCITQWSWNSWVLVGLKLCIGWQF